MTPTRTRAPVQAIVVYAALGIAIGMVVWALALQGEGGSGGGSGDEKPLQMDRTQNEKTQKRPQGEDG